MEVGSDEGLLAELYASSRKVIDFVYIPYLGIHIIKTATLSLSPELIQRKHDSA